MKGDYWLPVEGDALLTAVPSPCVCLCGAQMYHHFTCATDTGNVSTVFNACKEIILQDNLKGSGFMD